MTNQNNDITESKRLKEALREGEKRYRSLFEESRDGIYIIARDGEIIDFNRAGLDIFGYTRDEMIGMNVLELYDDPADRSRFKQTIEEMGSVRDYEIKFRRKDGTGIDCLLTSSVCRASHGSILGYQGIVRDITERKELEKKLKDYTENLEKLAEERTQALSESEEKLRAILTGMGDIITIQNKDLDIIWVNQTVRDLWGEVIGKKCYEVYKKLPAPCPGCSVETVFKEEKTVVSESLMSRPDGRNIHTLLTSSPVRDAEGNIVAVVEVSKDITERKKLEWQLKDYTENLEKLVEERTKALRESEEKLSAILTGIGDIITIHNKDLDIIWVNQPLRDIWGDTVGKKCYKEYHRAEEQCPGCKPRLEKVFNEGKTVVWEGEVIRPDGSRMPLLTTVSPVRDSEGNIVAMVEVCKDNTERKRAEKEMLKLNEDLKRKTVELEDLNKELESFSYSVSHDLRAPLRTIDGFSNALLEDYTEVLDAQGKDYLQRVHAATQHMAELIDALLVLSRVTRSEMHRELVDMSVMAQTIATELQEKQPERQADFIITPGLVAEGDARLLRSVLENLLGNAWKFTQKKPHARIEFGITEHEGESVYFVRDNGAGFDNAYTDKLFSAFQRLHSPDEFTGIGIGLATVKRIIHRHGGRVWAEGEVEKGATFYFTL